jgi:hypothetical protein
MDIQSAAKYMAHGYRVRRSSWSIEQYLHDYAGITKFQIHVSHVYNFDLKETEDHFHPEQNDMSPLELDDLLADDWELITTGIRTHFNEFGHIEYEDEKSEEE